MVHGAYSGPLYGSGLRCQKARSETRPKLEHRQVPRSKTVRLDRIERPYSELGFEPSVDLDEGMRETMAGNHRMGLL